MQLSPAQRLALEALLRAFLPATPPLSASSLQTRIEVILGMVGATTPREQRDFLQLLDLLAGRIAPFIYTGKARPFAALPLDGQTRLLRAWSCSRIGLLRKAFSSLKKLSLFAHYGSFEAGHPAWTAMQYPGPLQAPIKEPLPRLEPISARDGEVLDCDVLVIGSGAGGGIAAGILAEAGHSVLILEKGPYLEGEDFSDREGDMLRASHEAQGALVTRDGGVGIYAGSCLGGGTTINWTASFRTPGYVLEEWHRSDGLTFALGSEYAKHMDAVADSIHVNSAHSPHNAQNAALWRGAEKLGRKPEVIARNVAGCEGDDCKACGYCGMGCRQGNKQGTLRTWLRRAAAKGARILVHAEAQRITQAQGRVSGVNVTLRKPGQAPQQIFVRTKRVVLAAGSLHSPAILMRSGIQHAGIGEHLYLHPTVAVAGFYDEPTQPWFGPMMSAVDKAGMQVSGNFGYWIETPPVHAGIAALALPWEYPAQHQADMNRINHMATFVVLTRDRHGGRVLLDKQGHPVIDYGLHPFDRGNMLQGIRMAFEIHRAAGAYEVVLPHFQHSRFKLRTAKVSAESYLDRMAQWSWQANRYALFSAHQMGTCAMGDDPKRHPFTPEGECRELKGLFIADGSALPSSAGVNPMLSIMTLAGWVAKGL